MADSYTDQLSFGRKMKRNWPVALFGITAILFGGSGLVAAALGFPSVAGILVAYLLVLVLLLIFFAILPVYLLDLLDRVGQ